MKLTTTIIFCTIFSVLLQAQNPAKLLKQANKAFEMEHYRTARHLYKDYLNLSPETALANYRLGICDLMTTDYKAGLSLIQKGLLKDPSIDKYADFWLGRAYHLNYQFEEAITHYEKYLSLLGEKYDHAQKVAQKYIEECKYGKVLCALPSSYKIKHLGKQLNSPYADHSPIVTQDGLTLYFTSRRDHEDLEYLKEHEGEFNENIYVSHQTLDGNWSLPQPIESLETGVHHEATSMLFDDDRRMLVYKNKGYGDIYVTEQDEEGVWSTAYPLNINSKAMESDAFISHDNKVLIFASSRQSDLKEENLDLYMSYRVSDKEWGEPFSISPKINSSYNENSPFLSKDKMTLFFSSDGHNSMGGYDVFKSEFDSASMQWSEPVNLGHPINTPGDDIYFYFSDQNAWSGYFASYRKGGQGEKDIYHVQFIPHVELLGQVVNVADDKPVEGIDITFLPQDEVVSSEISSQPNEYASLTNEQGKYKLSVLSNQRYMVKITYEGDTVQTEEFSIPLLSEDSLQVFTKNFSIELPEVIYEKMLASIRDREEGATEERMKDIKKSARERRAVVSSSSYARSSTSKVEQHQKSIIKGNAKQTSKETAMAHFEMKEGEFVSGCRSILRNVYFEFDKAVLLPESYVELNNLACLLQEYPKNRLEISGHTDAVGPHAYNMELSQKRAQAVVDYLIKQGVRKERLTAKGYGETRPLASNDDEIEGRKLNRRTEFYVLSSEIIHVSR